MPSLADCRRLVLATTNSNKLRELAVLLAPLRVPLIGLNEVGESALPAPEDGVSLPEIARAKAAHYARCLQAWVLSDDTGLEVAALGGAPGVRSARYAGNGASMAENRARLLADLQAIGPSDRTARFVCCLAIAAPDGSVVLEATGACSGRLRTEPSGAGGFGYDVLFEVDGVGQTLAELDEPTTARVGHRGHAARQLIAKWENGR